MAVKREPYLVTVIKRIGALEAVDEPSWDEVHDLNRCRRWLGKHYPEVGAALAREYAALNGKETP